MYSWIVFEFCKKLHSEDSENFSFLAIEVWIFCLFLDALSAFFFLLVHVNDFLCVFCIRNDSNWNFPFSVPVHSAASSTIAADHRGR